MDTRELILNIKMEFDDIKKQALIEELLTKYMSLIKEEVAKFDNSPLDSEDLIQEGYLAFIEAIENYDMTKAVSFDDFLKRSIKKGINNAIEEYNNTSSIPEHIVKQLNDIMDVEKELFSRNKRSASLTEVANYLNLSVDELKELKGYAIKALNITTNNLEKPLIEIINNYQSIDEDDDNEENLEMLKFAIETLNDKEKEICKMYYGLDGYDKMNNIEIGKKLNISMEKVRQVISLVKTKLKKEMEQ